MKRQIVRALRGRRQAIADSCSGDATCPRVQYHHPACLARYRTEREVAAGIRPTDQALRARRTIVQADNVWEIIRHYSQQRGRTT